MEINTKFNINQLVKRKYDVDCKDTVSAMEIMEIQSQTCYAETQIFYQCKMIVAKKEFENKYHAPDKYTWSIGHEIGTGDGSKGWHLYREDELVYCSKEILDIINKQ
jgi:hypothetical protein